MTTPPEFDIAGLTLEEIKQLENRFRRAARSAVRGRPIAELGLSPGTTTRLLGAGIVSIGDLEAIGEYGCLKIPRIGRGTLEREIKMELAQLGLSLIHRGYTPADPERANRLRHLLFKSAYHESAPSECEYFHVGT